MGQKVSKILRGKLFQSELTAILTLNAMGGLMKDTFRHSEPQIVTYFSRETTELKWQGKILDQRIYGKGIRPQRKAKGIPRIMVQYVPECQMCTIKETVQTGDGQNAPQGSRRQRWVTTGCMSVCREEVQTAGQFRAELVPNTQEVKQA